MSPSLSSANGGAAGHANPPELSVVVATYNRAKLLLPLLDGLAEQTLGHDRFEVVVVDDGSREPVKPMISEHSVPYDLRVIEQSNAGPAAARHRGIEQARGEIIVIVDDDMQPAPGLLEEHLRLQREGYSVVLGHIRAAPTLGHKPLFERFHAQQLDKQVAKFRSGTPARGVHLCTGNVSFRRGDYLRVGGFDASLGRSEDRDLGIRLEASGARFIFSEEAYTVHESDHTSLEVWLKRAFLYGVFDSRIGSKRDTPSTSPWRFFFLVNPLSRPLLLATVASPSAGRALSRGVMRVGEWLDARGLESAALQATTLVYGLEYFRGVREDAGSLPASLRALVGYAMKRDSVPRQ